MTWLLRKRSAAFLHALWLLVLLRMVLPPAFAFPTGWGWWLRDGNEKEVATIHKPSVSTNQNASALKSDNTTAAPTELAAQQQTLPLTQDEPVEPADLKTVSVGPAIPQSTQSIQLILMLCWAGVATALLAMLARGQWLTWQWVRKAQKCDDERLSRIMERCCKRLAIKRPIGLRDSEACSTPLVVGLFRPIILLPSSVPEQLSDQELEAVITHELAHVTRHDALVNLFQGVLSALYFFHPLVWWTNFQIHRLREEACDELTVFALNGRRKAYGSAIIKVTEILGYAPSPLAFGIMEAKTSAKRRLSRILDPDLPRGHGVKWSSAAFVFFVGAVLLPCGEKPSAASIASTIAFLTGVETELPKEGESNAENAPKDSPPSKSDSAGSKPDKKEDSNHRGAGAGSGREERGTQSSGMDTELAVQNDVPDANRNQVVPPVGEKRQSRSQPQRLSRKSIGNTSGRTSNT